MGARDEADRLILAAAPEQQAKLRALWRELDPKIEIRCDASNILLQATADGIDFTNRFMRTFWLLGFTAWEALRCYSPALVVATARGDTAAAVLDIDESYSNARVALEGFLNAAKSLRQGIATWPAQIPQPQADQTGLSVEQRAAFQLVMIGTAYALLHEVEHIRHALRHTNPSAEEELRCDTFARQFLTERIGEYVAISGEPYAEVLSKRAMGIALGAFVVGEITPAPARAGTLDYPPLIWRLSALLEGTRLPNDDKFWIFASSLLITLARLHERSLTVVQGAPKAMFDQLMDMTRLRWEA
jgi:hypothetical protein